MKQHINAISPEYRSCDRAAAIDKAARKIVQVLERETQFLDSRVVRRLGNIREAALRLRDLSVGANVNASPVAHGLEIRHDD